MQCECVNCSNLIVSQTTPQHNWGFISNLTFLSSGVRDVSQCRCLVVAGCLTRHQEFWRGWMRVVEAENGDQINSRLQRRAVDNDHVAHHCPHNFTLIYSSSQNMSVQVFTHLLCPPSLSLSSSQRTSEIVCLCGTNCAMPSAGLPTRSLAALWVSFSRSTCWMWLR